MASFMPFYFLLLLSLASASTNTAIPLSNFTELLTSRPSQTFDSFQSTSYILRSNLPKQKVYSSLSAEIPIFSKLHINYIPLSFGTPPQTVHFILDTSTSLTWFPCGLNYSYHNNSSIYRYLTKINKIFYPSLSTSSEFIGCRNPKSQWFLRPKSQCQRCKENHVRNCLQPLDYKVNYGEILGTTTGIFLSETIKLSHYNFQDLVVGCSSSSSHLCIGIAGFSRGILSLPSQLGIRKFTYCLSNSRFNDKPQNSYLVLNSGSHIRGLSYTPFLNTRPAKLFGEYYYVVLKDIIIGRKSIKIPRRISKPRYEGYGGTILDSGNPYTIIERSIFLIVLGEFEKQLGRKAIIGKIDNARCCFNMSGIKLDSFPGLAFRFKGDATMKLPLGNYLRDGNEEGIACLPFQSKDSGPSSGPAIVLGNMQQRDFYMMYDLENEKFGFRTEKCT